MVSKKFNTCLHFDMNDPTHSKAVEILKSYEKKNFHSYTNLVAAALVEFAENRSSDNVAEIVNALSPKFDEIADLIKCGYANQVKIKNPSAAVSADMPVIKKSENATIDENANSDNSADTAKEKIINSIDSSFLSGFSTKINIGT